MAEEVLPLPDPSKIQTGETKASTKTSTISVSNKSGYMCNINLECFFDVPPQVIFSIFTNPGKHSCWRADAALGFSLQTAPAALAYPDHT
jgi:hypothetical protein